MAPAVRTRLSLDHPGRSYAREIAAQYGISYDQLSALLRQRGMLE